MLNNGRENPFAPRTFIFTNAQECGTHLNIQTFLHKLLRYCKRCSGNSPVTTIAYTNTSVNARWTGTRTALNDFIHRLGLIDSNSDWSVDWMKWTWCKMLKYSILGDVHFTQEIVYKYGIEHMIVSLSSTLQQNRTATLSEIYLCWLREYFKDSKFY